MSNKFYYHKATLGGLVMLLENFNPTEPLCCSTDASSSLFWRDVVLVLDTDIEPIQYEKQDIGSKISCYDEARLEFATKDDFLKSIKYIIFNGNHDYSKGDIAEYKSHFSEFSDLMGEAGREMYKFFIKEKGLEDWYGIKMLNITQAKKIYPKWDREFLNI